MDKVLSAPLLDAAHEPGCAAPAPLRLAPDRHAPPTPGGGLAAWLFAAAQRHRRLLRHHALGDWERVRVLAKAMRRHSTRRPRLDFDLDVCLAGIYARDHALSDALARLAPWRARLRTRPGAFDAAVAGVHLMAGDTAGHVAALARAQQQAPQDASRRLELALAEARFGDLGRAEALLGDALAGPVARHGRAAWARGLLQLRRGRPEAPATLDGAVIQLAAEAAAHEAWIALAACACDHAIALHQAGRSPAARARIAAAWPVLQHHATVPLLRMLEADGLLPARTPPKT